MDRLDEKQRQLNDLRRRVVRLRRWFMVVLAVELVVVAGLVVARTVGPEEPVAVEAVTS